MGLFGHAGDDKVWDGMDEGTLTKTKEMLDDIHKRMIDMTDFIGVFQICLNSGNTSWCQNYLNCCSNKKKHTFTPNVL